MANPLTPDITKRYSEMFRAAAEASDFDDLNHAIAGRSVGRQRKHIYDDDTDPVTGEKRKSIAQRAVETLEWLLLNDAAYRQAHENLIVSLREVQVVADSLLIDLHRQLDAAQHNLSILLSKAARLPDGRAVFKYTDGVVRDEDGHKIDLALAAGIEWRDDMPSGEEYDAAKDRIQSVEQAIRDVQGVQNELGDIHNRATDNDNPLTSTDDIEAEANKVDDVKKRLDNIMQGVKNNLQGKPIIAQQEEQPAIDAVSKGKTELPIIKVGS